MDDIESDEIDRVREEIDKVKEEIERKYMDISPYIGTDTSRTGVKSSLDS